LARKQPPKHALTPDEVHGLQSEFIGCIAPESHFHVALNQLGNVRVVVKDAAGRFVWVSDNASRRHGFAEPSEMVGLDDTAINPPRLVKKYRRDDLQVLRSGRPLLGRIELAFDERGMLNWHVTNKFPLCDHSGRCIGLIATIQEYPGVQNLPVFGGELKAVVEHVFTHLDEPLQVAKLAAMAGVSRRQIERRFRNATGMSPTDFISRARLDEACRRLRDGSESIGKIAIDLGFYDQSAFTRLFRRHLGTTPSDFRQMRGSAEGTGRRPRRRLRTSVQKRSRKPKRGVDGA
jgi:AraC-like DNA-binding protein